MVFAHGSSRGVLAPQFSLETAGVRIPSLSRRSLRAGDSRDPRGREILLHAATVHARGRVEAARNDRVAAPPAADRTARRPPRPGTHHLAGTGDCRITRPQARAFEYPDT